ncbi:putative Zinc finger, BED-type [Corchorus olitorius]|uniref:Zinc finger, BED-type n=1 Tax=Corchorus olitorius TaxID=93759 RepID=A0A1R3K9C9_9ROSI|nr:putative Zinc finger, BED-type [Corchorus olitorius]
MSSSTPDDASTPIHPPTDSSHSRVLRNDDLGLDAIDPSDKSEDAINLDNDGTEENEGDGIGKNKRQKTSKCWSEMKETSLPDGTQKAQCIHCKKKLSILASGCTSHLTRHLKGCLKRKIYLNQQKKINFQPEQADTSNVQLMPTLIDGKFDMGRMRESVAQWIMMHEHPFSIVEEEGFNMMQRRGMPEWEKVSRVTIKNDCMQIYETEKKRLVQLLKTVNKVSLTTDLWKSSNQKIEYMVLTAHFIDSD